MRTDLRLTSTAVATLVVLSTVSAVALVGAGALAASTGTAAADHDSPGNYTIVLPEESDHQTGDQNPEGASIQHFASLEGGFADAGTEGFEAADYLIISSQEIDFSGCGTADTEAFGIDRGNDNEGTQTDQDLVQHRKDSDFGADELVVEFYNEGDLPSDPPAIYAEDAIVAVQSTCYTMPAEEGWYQIDGFLNGTTTDGDYEEIELSSHYVPICDGCHDEATAEERLGPAPSQEGGETGSDDGSDDGGDGDATTETPAPDDPDAEEAGSGDDGQTDDGDGDSEATDQAGTDDVQDDGSGTTDDQEGDAGTGTGESDDRSDDGQKGDGGSTPAAGDGPGFTAVTAVLALLGSALAARRL